MKYEQKFLENSSKLCIYNNLKYTTGYYNSVLFTLDVIFGEDIYVKLLTTIICGQLPFCNVFKYLPSVNQCQIYGVRSKTDRDFLSCWSGYNMRA